MVAGGKGVIRSMMCEATFTAEVIPVDQAINGLIGIAYTNGTMNKKFVADSLAGSVEEIIFLNF